MAQQRGPGGPGQSRGGFQKPKNLRKTVSRPLSLSRNRIMGCPSVPNPLRDNSV